jgi:hypothetical protein
MVDYNEKLIYFRRFLKELKLGTLLYKVYYAPKSFLRRLFQKGIINTIIDYSEQREMQKAVCNLKPIERIQKKGFIEVHFLTGKRFWYQTIFCAYSLAQHIEYSVRPIIYDDGSLEKQHQDEILRIFPDAKIILEVEIEEYIDKYLPQSRFPCLRERRINYPNIRKVIDTHVGSQGWKLVLDSDMLFFRTPNVLLEWLESPQQPCHMVDVETSYGYSRDLMTELAQSEISEQINVGICGLKSEDIDWEKLEYWCKTMIDQQGTHYFQEQALVAMLMAGKSCTVASASDYIVMPGRDEVIQPKAVLHHYVADSKPWYFRYGWKHVFVQSKVS